MNIIRKELYKKMVESRLRLVAFADSIGENYRDIFDYMTGITCPDMFKAYKLSKELESEDIKNYIIKMLDIISTRMEGDECIALSQLEEPTMQTVIKINDQSSWFKNDLSKEDKNKPIEQLYDFYLINIKSLLAKDDNISDIDLPDERYLKQMYNSIGLKDLITIYINLSDSKLSLSDYSVSNSLLERYIVLNLAKFRKELKICKQDVVNFTSCSLNDLNDIEQHSMYPNGAVAKLIVTYILGKLK